MRSVFAHLSGRVTDRTKDRVNKCIGVLVVAFLILPAAASAAVLRLDEYSPRDDVLRWIDGYREHPDPAGVPTGMKLLSQRGVLRDPDSAGVYVGFMAGILGANPAGAE